MTFGSGEQAAAITNESLEQLKTVYNTRWIEEFNDNFHIIAIMNMWFVTASASNETVDICVYYYYDLQNENNQIYRGFYTGSFTYNTTTGLYGYNPLNGREATHETHSLTPEELADLTMFYTNSITENMTPDELNAYVLSLLPVLLIVPVPVPVPVPTP